LRGRAAIRDLAAQWAESTQRRTDRVEAGRMAKRQSVCGIIRQAAVRSDTRLLTSTFRDGLITRMEIRKSEPDTASTADREFFHSRMIPAPRERVFEAFSDPAQLARWWGPDGFTSTFEKFDLRPGGTWRFVMHGPDGVDYPNESVFVDVTPPERVVFDHISGHHFRMTIALLAQGETTVVEWCQVFDSAAERARIAEFVTEANEQNLDRLSAVVLDDK
jgi:uncharacterized protein YndB with AHSA1/START domain